ncbi:HAD family hydrolase [Amycolatopsis thermophila]|uniref:FMN phosphatase YigB (HAD superfamily) n=1 Tax=Amycolatopsis thermophila TaxID=206084 RepID=A0ABU0ERN9_9PSEU|nr:HAD family hydrolase [Amycolatopsis thermophila]MDQ0377467.1 FMN phosphatase YigB (HAD superfamily) [Amycolatopsis thermophila]
MSVPPSLARVRRLITDGSCAALSLDVFDTILWRRTPRPTDLFAVLGARLVRDGRCPDWVTPAAFRRMRIVAEQAARRADEALGTEVSLFDIWQHMPLRIFNADLSELVHAEVLCERDFTVPDLDIAELVELAGKHHVPTVLVSDTYFTEEHLTELLDRPGLGALREARIFRSHQHGLDKTDGLWEIVLDALDVHPEQIVHIGDNAIADIEVPQELGIRTVHYERLDERFLAVLEREREPLGLEDPLGDHLDTDEGDFGLTSLRAKTLQRVDPGAQTPVRTAWRYGASVLGPVLTGFAEWVAARAHESGIAVLWCPMREGTLLSALINNAAQARGWTVEARPVWLSRHVTSLAALDPADAGSLREFVRQRHGLTVRQLLQALHLRPGEVPPLAEMLDTVLDNDREIDLISDVLTETAHLRNRLTVTVTRIRERVVRELRRTGMLEEAEPALVDLGWGGTIQFFLGQVLEQAGTGARPAGFYLATDDRSTRVFRAGLRIEGYLSQGGHPPEIARTISRSPEVLEQSVNDFCGSLLDFADDGSPVLGPASDSEAQLAQRRAVQDGIREFQNQWYRYAEDGWPDLTGTARHRLANILVSALKAPTAEEAAVFGNWAHEDNFGSALVTRVVPEDLVPAVPYLSPGDLADLTMRDAFWPALLAASDTRLAAGARALADKQVDPGLFEPSDEPAMTRLSVRTGDGEWQDGPGRRVRINHNGLSFARLDFRAADITDLALAIPGRPALVRIDWVEVRALVPGQAVPRVERWDKPDDFAGLIHAACRWLGGTLFEFDGDESAIWFPVGARMGAPVTSGQVTVAFAMLPKSRTGLGGRPPSAPRLTRVTSRVREEYRTRGPVGLATSAARIAVRQLRSGK